MPFSKRRVVVIGGGPSGIVATKCLKEENMEPVCYEKTPHFGGTWRYHDDDEEGIGSVMWTTTLNHSKEMGAASDFPPKAEYPNYMRHHELLEMFQDYAKKFDVYRHIHYNREVVFVSKAEDYEPTGRWKVKTKNHETGIITDEIFDGVMVCIGHLSHPKMPTFPGMEKYTGKVMHTHSLKNVDEFKGQTVVVVGIGCSGLDAAVEISNVAKQVYLSAKTGAWIFPRVGPCGVPLDFALLRRIFSPSHEQTRVTILNFFLENFLNNWFNHDVYKVKPKCGPMNKEPAVSDVLPSKLLTGSVLVKKNVKYFTEKGVIFDDEEHITEADAVIIATGYTWKFPFLDKGILTTENERINLYKCMYPYQLPHPTLAIIGFLLSLGALFPLTELQCRWASHILAGKSRLPSADTMKADIIKRHERNLKRYTTSDKISIRVDCISYSDDIASQFGVRPNFLKMAFRDPKLFKACIFGPCLPYQFRLGGPHSWPGAREAILTSHNRIIRPLSGSNGSMKRIFSDSFVLRHSILVTIQSLFLALVDSKFKFYFVAMFPLYFLLWRSVSFKYLFLVLVLLFIVFKW